MFILINFIVLTPLPTEEYLDGSFQAGIFFYGRKGLVPKKSSSKTLTT
jgi:hypothetical protein